MNAPLKRLLPPLLALLWAVPHLHAQAGANRNVRFGLPSPAKADPKQREDYLIERPQYVLSYNDRTRTPNWVCWHLTKRDVGRADRGPFEPDPLLPRGFTKVTSGEYSRSDVDRGHTCPSKDRSDKEENNDPTFYLTNIVPQAPNCNQRGWERLESYCRDLAAKEDKELYICCGPAGKGGAGKDGPRETVGRKKITVPAKVWKVVLVLPHKDAEPRRNSRVIAVIMPNDQTVDHDWASPGRDGRHR